MFIKGGIILQWSVKRDYISQNLCVKRNLKNNDCNGQCHLSKQLDKADNTSNNGQASIPLKLKLNETEGLPILNSCHITWPICTLQNQFSPFGISLYQFLPFKTKDRPPQHLA
jgi:hypothetical protein